MRGQKPSWGEAEGRNEEWMVVGAEEAGVVAIRWLDWVGGGRERWKDRVVEDQGR